MTLPELVKSDNYIRGEAIAYIPRGEEAIYDNAEIGTIVSGNERFIFVNFKESATNQACSREDLWNMI